jgi:hypothetical protein
VLTYNHSLQPTILNDNVNQLKVGLEGLFHIKSQDNDVDVPLILPAIEHTTCNRNKYINFNW